MRRIQPATKSRALITKQRAMVLVVVLMLFFAAISIPQLAAQPSTRQQYVANPDLGLYSISDLYKEHETTYDLTFPFLGQESFDSEIAATVQEEKEAFHTALDKAPSYAPSQLRINYTTYFYNKDYLSLSVTTEQNISEHAKSSEKTFLYNRTEQKMTPLKALFSNDKYPDTLSKTARTALKEQLKDAYDKKLVNQHTKPKAESFHGFIINEKQQLELVFQPGAVAPEQDGVVKVAVNGADIRDITDKKIAKKLVKIPPKPEPKKTEPNLESAPLPSLNLNPAPVPQADPNGVDCAVAACVALTFDDGPKAPTDTLLDILDANNAKATFFVLGMQAERYPGTVQRIHNSGHLVANHTYDHQNLQQISVADAAGQLSRTADIVQGITGVRPGLARAPYGAIDQNLAVTLGMPFISWSVDPQDWMVRDAAHVCNSIVSGAHSGAIILAHDIHQSSVDGLRCAVPQLIERGFILVTVPQLMGFGPDTPPGIYSSR